MIVAHKRPTITRWQTMNSSPKISELSAQAFTVPAESAESDGTLCWGSTTLVLVRDFAGDHAFDIGKHKERDVVDFSVTC